MQVKDRLVGQLKMSRDFTDSILAAFETPEQWVHQVHKNANHALWFAGHMGQTDNFIIGLLKPEKSQPNETYKKKFGMGSQPTNKAADYPPAAEVLDYMRERRETLLSLLSGLKESDLEKPAPEGTPDFLKDYASFFEMLAWHEGMHAGQVTIARRSLGHEPLFAPAAPAAV